MIGSPVVSVILPIYNVEGYLRRCLDSVRTQTLKDIEIICVDDGSTDGSGAILDEYAAKDGRFRVIHQPNSGAGAARNRGLAEARGKYLFFCDADDWCEESLLDRTVEAAERMDADVVVFEYDRIYLDGTPTKGMRVGSGHETEFHAASELSADLFQTVKMMPWNKLFRRDYVQRKGLSFQNLPRGNDVYFVCCAAALTDRMAILHETLYHHICLREDGLHRQFDRHPFTFYEAKDAVRDELQRRGVYARFAGSLAMCVYSEAFGLLDRYEDERIFAEAYGRLRGRLLNDPAYDIRNWTGLSSDKRRRYKMILRYSDPMKYRAVVQMRRRVKRLLKASMKSIRRFSKALRKAIPRVHLALRSFCSKALGSFPGQCKSRILMVRTASSGRAGSAMFFVSTLKRILEPLGYRVDVGTREFWDRRRHYDIVHIHWPHMLVRSKGRETSEADVTAIRRRLEELKTQGTAIVYTRHNEIRHYSTNPNEVALCRLVEEVSDRVIHMGRASFNQMGPGRGQKDVIIPHHGFDRYPIADRSVARQRLGLSAKARVVAAVGTYRDARERQLVLAACRGLEIPDFRLLSPGLFKATKTEDKAAVRALRERLGDVYPQQKEGWISVGEMTDCLSAADVVFLQRVEVLNSGNLPLGFHFGKVVVGPDRGNVGEILRATGNPVFDPEDPASVTDALKAGLELAERGKGAENAEYARQNWNFKAIARAHDELYCGVRLEVSGRVHPFLAVHYIDTPNMGDQLNPLIIGRLFGYDVIPICKKRFGCARMTAIGSYLGRMARYQESHCLPCSVLPMVWGTGFMAYDAPVPADDPHIDIRAVRGELSRKMLEARFGRKLDVPTGDPGLLAARLLDSPVQRTYDLGIIAHFRERDDPRFAKLAKLAKRPLIIDVTRNPLSVIRQIASCERILSSSLHGLIIADSLGIPNLHIRVTDALMGDGFKFDDYYSSYGLKHEFVDLNSSRIDRLEEIDERYRVPAELVRIKQERLFAAFPFPRVEWRSPLPSWTAPLVFLAPLGIMRRKARCICGLDIVCLAHARGGMKARIRRALLSLIPFGFVALVRHLRFDEPMSEILTGGAFLRTVSW